MGFIEYSTINAGGASASSRRKIHLEIDCKIQNYLDEMMRTDYRTWLIIHGMTEKEFFKKKREDLRSCV